MKRTDIGPRVIAGKFAYNRAIRVDDPGSWLFVSGHEARGDDGRIAHRGDMAGQLALTVKRLDETVTESGMTMADIVQIRIVTTDLTECKKHYGVLLDELARRECRPTSLLAQVDALSDPDMLVEIEAVAVQGKRA
ncbi:MAG: enamine deaminase RidA [Amycolatopsis sp.]|nr:enamine deaminase RidA [Amycolatopsis sp.]